MEDPDYMQNIIIFAIVTAIIVLLVLGMLFVVYAQQKPFIATTELFYEQPRVPYRPEIIVLGTIVDVSTNISEINIVDTMNCMIELESGGNHNAINPEDTDGLPAYGLLQFKRGTFNQFCVNEYGYPDDIWDYGIQYLCASRMINSGNGWHWPSFAKCNSY